MTNNKRTPGKPLAEVFAPKLIPASSFQAVTFFDETQKRQVIVLYALGSDGIVREFINGAWNQYPIHQPETNA